MTKPPEKTPGQNPHDNSPDKKKPTKPLYKQTNPPPPRRDTHTIPIHSPRKTPPSATPPRNKRPPPCKNPPPPHRDNSPTSDNLPPATNPPPKTSRTITLLIAKTPREPTPTVDYSTPLPTRQSPPPIKHNDVQNPSDRTPRDNTALHHKSYLY